MPDQNSLGEELTGWTGAQIRTKLNCSPLKFHGWACLLCRAKTETLTVARTVDPIEFWKQFVEFESDREAFDDYPPGPHILASAAAQSAA